MATYELYFQKLSPGFVGPISDFVQGTITTDCNNCITSASDIVDWNITVAVHGMPISILNTSNSLMKFSGVNDLVANPYALLFDFGMPSLYPMWFANATDGSILEFAPNLIAWQIGSTEAIIPGPANDAIGMAVAAVPEPGTWVLLLLGVLAWQICTRVSRTRGRVATFDRRGSARATAS